MLAVPFLVVGALYYFGHPQPRARALRMAVGVPLATALLTALSFVVWWAVTRG